MEIVRTVKRIIVLNEALKRIPTTRKYDDVWEKISDKRELLVSTLNAYTHASNDRKIRYYKRKNIRLTCKLLKVDYYTIIR